MADEKLSKIYSDIRKRLLEAIKKAKTQEKAIKECENLENQLNSIFYGDKKEIGNKILGTIKEKPYKDNTEVQNVIEKMIKNSESKANNIDLENCQEKASEIPTGFIKTNDRQSFNTKSITKKGITDKLKYLNYEFEDFSKEFGENIATSVTPQDIEKAIKKYKKAGKNFKKKYKKILTELKKVNDNNKKINTISLLEKDYGENAPISLSNFKNSLDALNQAYFSIFQINDAKTIEELKTKDIGDIFEYSIAYALSLLGNKQKIENEIEKKVIEELDISKIKTGDVNVKEINDNGDVKFFSSVSKINEEKIIKALNKKDTNEKKLTIKDKLLIKLSDNGAVLNVSFDKKEDDKVDIYFEINDEKLKQISGSPYTFRQQKADISFNGNGYSLKNWKDASQGTFETQVLYALHRTIGKNPEDKIKLLQKGFASEDNNDIAVTKNIINLSMFADAVVGLSQTSVSTKEKPNAQFNASAQILIINDRKNSHIDVIPIQSLFSYNENEIQKFDEKKVNYQPYSLDDLKKIASSLKDNQYKTIAKKIETDKNNNVTITDKENNEIKINDDDSKYLIFSSFLASTEASIKYSNIRGEISNKNKASINAIKT